jgi:glycosyltransferase involved in cell wall biosynthesis
VRVLFVVSDRSLSSKAPGGSGAVFGGLLALLRARGDEVYLVLLRDTSRPCRFEAWKNLDPDGAADLESWLTDIQSVEYESLSRPGFLTRKLIGIWDPQRRAYPFLDSCVGDGFTSVAERVAPSLIIAADLPSGLVVSRSQIRIPVVYYHHDFFWKIKDLLEADSNTSLRAKWGCIFRRRAELELIRSVDACITGSISEHEELKRCRAKRVFVVPPVVTERLRDIPNNAPEPCRIVHLGGFGTTATRLGLEQFLDVVWPVLKRSLPGIDFWVVGDTSSANRALLNRLESIGATVTGFVEDLSQVLRPCDLHVVPWALSTGVRTRVMSCFQYGQVLVAVRAGVLGYEGLESGKHCILVEELEDLADTIVEWAGDPQSRVALALGGQQYVKERLNVDAVRPHFDAVVESVTRAQTGPAA